MNFTYGLIFDWAYDVLIQKCLLSSSYVLKYCFGGEQVRIDLLWQSGRQTIEISKFQLVMGAMWTTNQ